MAKFTLTITDIANEEVEVEAEFSPAFKGPVEFDKLTPAQQYGATIMQHIQDSSKEGGGPKKGKSKKG